jgi:hypothetical protein
MTFSFAYDTEDLLPTRLERPNSACGGTYDDLNESLLITGNLRRGVHFLHKVELRSGQSVKRIFSNRGHGHSTIVSPSTRRGWLVPENGDLIYEFDLDSLDTLGTIEVESGMAGGHGVCSRDGKRLYFVDRAMRDGTMESNLVIYSVPERKVIKQCPDVGIFAHDVWITGDERLAIVASYGMVADFHGKGEWIAKLSPEALCKSQPSFALVELWTGKILEKKIFSERFSLAHVVCDAAATTAFIQGTRSVPLKEDMPTVIEKRGDPLTEEEKSRGRIFLHGEQLKVELKDLRIERLEDLRHNRAQSMAFSNKHRKLYNSYAVSKKILVIDTDSYKTRKVIDCAQVGLLDPRGLAVTQDEKFVIVTGRQENIYFLDAEKDEFIKGMTLISRNHLNAHINLFR